METTTNQESAIYQKKKRDHLRELQEEICFQMMLWKEIDLLTSLLASLNFQLMLEEVL